MKFYWMCNVHLTYITSEISSNNIAYQHLIKPPRHITKIHITNLLQYDLNIFSLVFSSDLELISYLCCIYTVTFFMYRPWPLICLVWQQRYHKIVPRGKSQVPLHRGHPVAVSLDSNSLLLALPGWWAAQGSAIVLVFPLHLDQHQICLM